MSYVVASKVKELLKGMDMMTAGELSDAASKFLEDALKKAAKRAQENGRKTVRACDL
jgi:histone H3/H4